MRRLLGLTFGVMVGLVAYTGTTTTEAQQSASTTCNGPTTVPAHSGGVKVDCQVENFPPNTSITFTGGSQATTDGAGRGSGTVIIPAGLCPGAFTITASGGGVAASTTIGVTPAPGPPGVCPAPVAAQPRLTG
jgi:hypothetical protein